MKSRHSQQRVRARRSEAQKARRLEPSAAVAIPNPWHVIGRFLFHSISTRTCSRHDKLQMPSQGDPTALQARDPVPPIPCTHPCDFPLSCPLTHALHPLPASRPRHPLPKASLKLVPREGRVHEFDLHFAFDASAPCRCAWSLPGRTLRGCAPCANPGTRARAPERRRYASHRLITRTAPASPVTPPCHSRRHPRHYRVTTFLLATEDPTNGCSLRSAVLGAPPRVPVPYPKGVSQPLRVPPLQTKKLYSFPSPSAGASP